MKQRTLFYQLSRLPRLAVAAAIRLYQLILSPDHSWLKGRFPYGYCRHYPSCSEYARQAVLSWGTAKGLLLGARRVLSCHPWAEPKFDPVPQKQ